MQIFLTGATGFIGSHVAKGLAGAGHSLVCLVRKTSYVKDLEKLGAELIWGDVRDRRKLVSGMSGCDALVHMAGIKSFWKPDRQIYADVNVMGTRNVMYCAESTRIPKILHMSSLYTYGKPYRLPFNEESAVGPERYSEFAKTMYEGERIAWGLYQKKKLPLTVCYPALAVGPSRHNRQNSIVARLLGQTVFSRSFLKSIHTYVHVQDVAEVVRRILDENDMVGRRCFITGERLTTRRVVSMIHSLAHTRHHKITLPDFLALNLARALAALAETLKRPPVLGLCPDYLASFQNGLIAEGNTALKDLGITSTPVAAGIRQEMESLRMAVAIREKRRSIRHPLIMELTFKAEGEKTEMTGSIMDISENGMLVNTQIGRAHV
jgi:dihydroflavonol-4-reductase